MSETKPDIEEHVFLVAVTVCGESREVAERHLHEVLPLPHRAQPDYMPVVEEWWIAENDRHDGSDNLSAIFIPDTIDQHDARMVVLQHIADEANRCPGCGLVVLDTMRCPWNNKGICTECCGKEH